MRSKLILGSFAIIVAGSAIATTAAVADPYYSNGYNSNDGRYYDRNSGGYDNGRDNGQGYYASDGQYYNRGGSGYDNGRYNDQGRRYSNSRYYQGERVYRGRSHYYRHRCGGGNGAVGTVGGGVGGALIGNALGGTAGTVLGGVGGALLGRHLDKQNTRDKRGC